MPASKYRFEYSEKLINHMALGASFKSFGGIVGVSKQTLYDWCQRHSEFAEAKDIGRAKSELFWINLGKKLSLGELKGSASAWIFMMKNLHGWSDNKDGHSDKEMQPINIQIVKDDSNSEAG